MNLDMCVACMSSRTQHTAQLFEDIGAANSTASKGGANSSSQSTNWRVHYPLHAAAEAGESFHIHCFSMALARRSLRVRMHTFEALSRHQRLY